MQNPLQLQFANAKLWCATYFMAEYIKQIKSEAKNAAEW